jgi:UDP-GlcNAc:undecaprenyl-phosphate/decaprenyl-phosphate GlcNAc-1-phosphate transferase
VKYALITAIFAAIALLALRVGAVRLNWLDQPDARKAHKLPVPAIGGVAWMLAFTLGMGLSGLVFEQPWLTGGLAIMCVLGAIDDRIPLPSILRLLVQALAVLIAFWQSPPLTNLGELIWPGHALLTGPLAWPITVFACVGVVNATNMIDGMDGLLGGVLLLVFCGLLGFFHHAGEVERALMLGLAVSALIPFLFLNIRTPWLREARVFFGDSGSMAAGLFVAWLLVTASQAPVSSFPAVTALFWLAVPLIDTVSLMLRRVQQGNSPFKPDQQHLHHLLQRAGFSVTHTLILVLTAVLLFQLVGILFFVFATPSSVQLLLFLCVAIGYHVSVTRAVVCGQWLGRKLELELS